MNYRFLTKIPGFNRFYPFYKNRQRQQKIRKGIRLLKSSGLSSAGKISSAIQRLVDDDMEEFSLLFDKIENERSTLDQNTDPLVDGTLGRAGIYDLQMTITDANKASKPAEAARFLALLAYYLKPGAILELGTNTGISSSYFVGRAGKLKGRAPWLVTLYPSAYRQRVAKTVQKNLGLTGIKYVQGLFSDTLEGVLNESAPWDLVFIDGHHLYKPTLDYFNQIYPYCREQAVVIFYDIRWSDGMKQAWNKLARDNRAVCAIDLFSVGILAAPKEKVQNHLRPETMELF